MTPLLIALGLLAAAPAGPQAVGVQDSIRSEPVGLRFLMGYGIDHHGMWQVEIYSPQGDNFSPDVFVARRSLATPAGLEQFTWTDTDICPALSAVVLEIANLPSVEIRRPGSSATGHPAPPLSSGAAFRAWGRAHQPEGSFADLEMSATSGPLAEWVIGADFKLKDCWRSE
ncbi:hypothetical protein [Brevundimonas sp.]|uniref:hypothetical protein n=1 Tax=Brevundimonas sp. TaxID=1871086 RepID=UPI0025C1B4E7|nr:hypothetical protein [Brevundimonas sp.]